MSLGVIALAFVVILIAELPDKSMFASLLLSTRFAARWVFAGAATAFAVHVVIAVSAGSLLTLLPHRVLEFVVAGLFLLGAGLLLQAARSDASDDQVPERAPRAATASPSSAAAATASFAVIFIGEWGDITQIATANLAAKYEAPVAVGIGAVLGLWVAALVAITAGRSLLRVVSVVVLHRIGAAIFAVLAAYSLDQAVSG